MASKSDSAILSGFTLPPIPSDTNIKVSILMITYNQEDFIAQAIESVLMQKTSFSFELVIGEDCSTDETRKIVYQYAKQYPDRIKLLENDENIGMALNFARTLAECKGQYIALLEGDDYWTSPHKLQIQADFLDQHQDYALCFHSTQCFYEDESQPSYAFPKDVPAKCSTLKKLLSGNFISTCSVVFRNRLFSHIPNWYFQLKLGDWPLHIFNAQHGKIGYIETTMSKYRIHAGGVWSMKKRIEVVRNVSKMLRFIDAHLNYEYTNLIAATNCKNYFYAAFEENALSRSASRHARLCLRQPKLYSHLELTTFLRMVACAWFPGIYIFLNSRMKQG